MDMFLPFDEKISLAHFIQHWMDIIPLHHEHDIAEFLSNIHEHEGDDLEGGEDVDFPVGEV